MGIPAQLSSVPAQTPYVQYVATSGQTVFPYNFEITQDSDLIVVANGVTLNTDSGYTVSGVGNSTGGNVTFTSGRTVGDIITLYRDIPISRLTQIAQNSGFSSAVFNAEFNNVYLLLQQLQQNLDQCLQIPNTNNPAPTTSLTPGAYANKYLAFDGNGNPEPADLTSSGSLTQSIIAGLFQPQTAVERTAGVTPTNYAYPFGDLRRYGATGAVAGSVPSTDDSAAWASAVKCGYVYIPKGYAFKITTGVSYTGRIAIVGDGPTSEIYSDGAVLTLTDGTGSRIDNFALYNVTAPWIITRDPTSWAKDISGTLAQSNAAGYMPTVNDSDVWSTLTTAQQNQSISPSIKTLGSTANASDIVISRLYGRFVFLHLQDVTDSVVCDCDFRGGKGPNGSFGGIWFDNYSNLNSTGYRNRATRNKVTYASFSGVCLTNCYDSVVSDNISCLNGESGIKTNHGTAPSLRTVVSGNVTDQNYFDGLDLQSASPASATNVTAHVVKGNRSYGNGGDGVNLDGKYTMCVGNTFQGNYRYGILDQGSYQNVSDNTLIDNNQARNSSYHEIASGSTQCKYTGNYIWMGSGANSDAIYCGPTNAHFVRDNTVVGGSMFLGNQGAQVTVDSNNSDATIGSPARQSFALHIRNNAGTLQHIFWSDINQTALGRVYKISGATNGSFTNTPTGTDSSTAFAAGVKVSTTTTNAVILNTAAQDAANNDMVASIAYNTTGTPLNVCAAIESIDVNGTTRDYLTFQLFNASTGAAVAVNTTNIGSGDYVVISFSGSLA